jgi:hypothetical protein
VLPELKQTGPKLMKKKKKLRIGAVGADFSRGITEFSFYTKLKCEFQTL